VPLVKRVVSGVKRVGMTYSIDCVLFLFVFYSDFFLTFLSNVFFVFLVLFVRVLAAIESC